MLLTLSADAGCRSSCRRCLLVINCVFNNYFLLVTSLSEEVIGGLNNMEKEADCDRDSCMTEDVIRVGAKKNCSSESHCC